MCVYVYVRETGRERERERQTDSRIRIKEAKLSLFTKCVMYSYKIHKVYLMINLFLTELFYMQTKAKKTNYRYFLPGFS